MTEAPLTILAVADGEFLGRAAALAASIACHMPAARLHACLVNVDPEPAERELRSRHANVEFSHERAALDAATVKVGLDGLTRYTEKAGYCVNLRGRAVLRLLRAGRPRVLFLDADSIVRRHLAPLCELIDAHDLVIHRRPHERDFMGVAGGVIGVRPTPRALEFFARAVDRIGLLGDREFFSDQLAFHQVLGELGPRLRVAHLPQPYIDWEFAADSFIWTGKGRRKYESEAYLAEERLYSRGGNRV
jgi:hypothetical protein